MSSRCKVCQHPEAEAIESAVAAGISQRSLATKYGVSQPTIWRHTHNCVIARTLSKHEALPKHVRIDTLGMLIRVGNALERVAQAAESESHWTSAVAGYRGLIELSVRLHEMKPPEDLQDKPITEHPQFAELRARLVAALDAFPEARGAVVKALTGPRKGGDS